MRYLLHQKFDSLDAFNAGINGWDMRFSAPKSGAFMAGVGVTPGHVARITMGAFHNATCQQASTPPAMVTFALPQRLPSTMQWRDFQVSDPSLLIFGQDRELFALAPAGTQIITVSIAEDVLQKQLSGWGLHRSTLSGSAQATRLQPGENDRLQHGLSRFGDFLRQYGLADEAPLFSESIYEDLVSLMSERLLRAVIDGTPVRASVAASHLRRSLEYIHAHRRLPVSATALAEEIGVSRRTLEKSFLKCLGMSPKQYLLRQRFEGCQQELLATNSGEATISNIATSWGFWHLGQFAVEYQRRFGERPGDTLSRSAARN